MAVKGRVSKITYTNYEGTQVSATGGNISSTIHMLFASLPPERRDWLLGELRTFNDRLNASVPHA